MTNKEISIYCQKRFKELTDFLGEKLLRVKYWSDRLLYGIEAWEHCPCESCKINRQRKKDFSTAGMVMYVIWGLWESRITWFLIGGIIASIFE